MVGTVVVGCIATTTTTLCEITWQPGDRALFHQPGEVGIEQGASFVDIAVVVVVVVVMVGKVGGMATILFLFFLPIPPKAQHLQITCPRTPRCGLHMACTPRPPTTRTPATTARRGSGGLAQPITRAVLIRIRDLIKRQQSLALVMLVLREV